MVGNRIWYLEVGGVFPEISTERLPDSVKLGNLTTSKEGGGQHGGATTRSVKSNNLRGFGL